MRELLKIVVFALIVICGFAGYTTFGLPLIVPEAPPVEEKLSGDITMDQYIAIGKKIYDGKGTCTLCHNALLRAPLLEPVAQLAPERLADSRYEAKATDIKEYIYESMVDPSAYVVATFGKTGSNDTISPMPDVSKGAIGLSEVEIYAVVAYLQDVGGVDVTVDLPTGDAAPEEEEESAEIVVAENVEEAMTKFDCATCHIHSTIEDGGDLGPDLTPLAKSAGTRKAGLSAREFIVESIIDPNAVIAPDFESDMMPDDLASSMTVTELNMIVDALLGKSGK